MRVLKEPRNSLVKQYKELLSMDSVELEFTDEALHAIARKTIVRKTGAPRSAQRHGRHPAACHV